MKTLVMASLALLPLTTFAQGFTTAECTQTYSYSGGYSVDVRVNDLAGGLASVSVGHYHGPDGDGYDQPAQTQMATLDASSTPSTPVYKLADGKKLELTPKKASGFLVTAQDRYELSCTFGNGAVATIQTADKCADALSQKGSDLLVRDQKGSVLRGFENGAYSEAAVTKASVVLETVKKVYFYSETSDISASLYECDKATASVKELFQSHAIGCSDLPKDATDAVLYTSCK